MAIQIAGPAVAAAVGWGLATIGIGTVTFVGAEFLLDEARVYIMNTLGGVSGDAAGLLGLLGVDTGISIILSAYTVRITLWAASQIRVR